MKPFRCKVAMRGGIDNPVGRAEFISDSNGRKGYLRIEDGHGVYVGSIDGRALTNLARLILGAYATPKRAARGAKR